MTLSEFQRQAADIDAELACIEERRQAVLASKRSLMAECYAVGVVRGAAGFQLAEMDGELRRLEERAERLSDEKAACEFRIEEGRRSLAEARRVLHELPASASSRREIEEIEALRRKAQRIIERLEG